MDIATIIGLVLGIGLIGGSMLFTSLNYGLSMGNFWSLESMMIVLGGTLSATAIAFRLNEYDELFIEGEIYISLQRAKENAKTYNEPYAKEVSRLIIHGCLHLIGFEDKSKAGIELMKQMEEDLLKFTNWKNIFTS